MQSLSQNINFNGSLAGKYYGPKSFDMSYCTQSEAESIYLLSLAHNKKFTPRGTQSAGVGFFGLQSIITQPFLKNYFFALCEKFMGMPRV